MPSRRAVITAAATAVLLLGKKKRSRVWVKEWVQRRVHLGAYHSLLPELQVEDAQNFRAFIRMSATELEEILTLVGPKIKKADTHLRPSIAARERLIVTLRFLATGDSYRSLMYLFRIPACTISKIVPEVCTALYEVLRTDHLKTPSCPNEWLNLAKAFEETWNFPHCVGALDGKHIIMQAPKHSGSYFFNYKGSHSIVLMALVDAAYRFIYVDVGCNGRISDGGVFANSSLYSALEQNRLNLPPSEPLPGRTVSVPYVVVADDAFPLKQYLLKPYPFRGQPAPNRIYNYRLSRVRRIVENAFGILANRFRVLRKPLLLGPKKSEAVVLAICALHNYLIGTKRTSQYIPSGILDSEDETEHTLIQGAWREEGFPGGNFFPLELVARNSSYTAKDLREEFKEYFMSSSGEVNWQYAHI